MTFLFYGKHQGLGNAWSAEPNREHSRKNILNNDCHVPKI